MRRHVGIHTHVPYVLYPRIRTVPARVRRDDEVHVGGVFDGVLQDGVDRHPVVRREFTHSLNDT